MTRIPKLIHQIWIGPLPAPVAMMATWRAKHPTWDYVLWTEENLPSLHCQKQYEAMPQWAGKADILRYEILAEFGGVYLDADSICLRPLDERFLDLNGVACFENEELRPHMVSNGFIGIESKSDFMQSVVEEIYGQDVLEYRVRKAWQATGPAFFTRALWKYRPEGFKIIPSWTFLPEHHLGRRYRGANRPFAIHGWGSTLDKKTDFGDGLLATSTDNFIVTTQGVDNNPGVPVEWL